MSALSDWRPIRPKPLMPTRTAIGGTSCGPSGIRGCGARRARVHLVGERGHSSKGAPALGPHPSRQVATRRIQDVETRNAPRLAAGAYPTRGDDGAGQPPILKTLL